MRLLIKLWRLSAADRRLLIEATLLLGMVAPGLRLLPFETVRRLMARAAQTLARSQKSDDDSAKRAVWAVMAASRYVPRAGAGVCLTQALAAQTMLARRGHPALLRIGVVKDEERRLQAHAWLESGGEVVIGGAANLERFVPLPTLQGDES
ncbi:MAG: lasso peptide biosynthesis B2 protein [Actinomycetota bacterium]|nr:lasso peptide biosynthesis B2 protein [Actinomycetota bacterium]